MKNIEFKRPELEDKKIVDGYFKLYPSQSYKEHLLMYFFGQDFTSKICYY